MSLQAQLKYVPHVPISPVDLGSTKEYFDTLPENDLNKKYFNGVIYTPKVSFIDRHYNFFSLDWKLKTLKNFYPYQKQIKATEEQIHQDEQLYLRNTVLFTGLSWTFLYQYARKGQVLPILKEYGSVLQTHRLFRQYLYTLVVPTVYALYHLHDKYNDHIEILWKTHTNRLNNKILTDPARSEYPNELRQPRRKIFENNYY